MEETNEELLKAVQKLLEIKEKTTDEVFQNATKEELERYIDLSEQINAKLKVLLGE